MSLLDPDSQRLQVLFSTAHPLISATLNECSCKARVAGDVSGSQEAGRGIQIAVGHIKDLFDRSHLVPQLESGVPQRIPEALGEVCNVDARAAEQDHVDVASGTELSSTVSADRHQCSCVRWGASLEHIYQKGVGALGESPAECRSR